MSLTGRLLLILALILLVLGAAKMLLISMPYFAMQRGTDFLETKQFYYDVKQWQFSFYFHVFTSWILLFSGILQFIPALHRRYPKTHKICGYIYVGILVLFSGPAAIILGVYANGGIAAKTSFVILGSLWLIFTCTALFYAIKNKLLLHGAFMLRSFALCISALTLRLYALILSYWDNGYQALDKYTLVAWLSWVPNLLIAEWLIQAGFVNRWMKAIKGN